MREEFEISKKGLLEQGVRSVDIWDTCSMRGASGKCCAVGFLLPDDEAESLDDQGFLPQSDYRMHRNEDLVYRNTAFFKIASSLNPDHNNFYADLQRIHDREDPEDWSRLLNAMEYKYFGEE